jgi:hypothetical protein
MHICDGDGNAFLCPWAAEGVDYGNPERALNKAMTNAVKYFLLKLFMVGAGGEDSEQEATGAGQGARRPGRGQPMDTSRRPAAVKPAAQRSSGAQPAEGSSERATPAQVNELQSVGRQAYGDGWDEKRRQLVLMISKGTSDAPEDLSPKEADDLIGGIKKKVAESAPQPQAPRQAIRFTTR